ncbi:ATP-binding protein [Algoriphagus sp. NG3]|uniref:ATP-binding protein n=1 Tax=unclassified Algoriphagus TaxID=2641541 RepID=UPI002A7EEE89|nr:ATP-binding protein [Algoriphagus sp. NG3]WPR74489.1 ATP-binding protein [Algoriphagus sp. NG3]
MHVSRTLFNTLQAKIDFNKAILLLGPRQVGKTTLVKKLAESISSNFLYLNGDEGRVQSSLAEPSISFLRSYLGQNKVVVLDEAQRIPTIGLTLKLIVDNFTDLQLIVTGSSALELSSTINEPLTGRKWEYKMYPLSWMEISSSLGMPEALSSLETYLVYGAYPEVVTQKGNEIPVLTNLATSYLYKDLLNFQGIRKPELLNKILQALAWQVGSEVSYSELSRTVQADKVTVSNYIDLLEKAFIIEKLNPFSRNLRSEISSSRKIYFLDNGIRNAIIGNYAPIPARNDIGALWENYLISERRKLLVYNGFYGQTYFWRTTRGQEIDYLEEIDGKLYPFEFKWNPNAKLKIPKTFQETYTSETPRVIHRDNFWEWLNVYPYKKA